MLDYLSTGHLHRHVVFDYQKVTVDCLLAVCEGVERIYNVFCINSAQQADFLPCVQGLFEALFFRLFRIYNASAPSPSSPFLLSSLSPALDYISRHYMESFPQETLAAECHLSPTHFRRKFQQQFGTNPLSYLHQVRIMKSCDLLRSTNLPIADIAEKVGYLSLSCFNRHFTELNGCTPSEWRNLRHETRRTTMIGLAGWERPETADEIERRNRTDGRESRGGL